MVEDGRIPYTKNVAELEAYSRRIARLRRILPVIAIFLVGLLLLAANPDFVPKAGQDAPEGADNRLIIDHPVLNGRGPDGRAYRLTALQGTQKNDGTMAVRDAQMNIAGNDKKPSLSFTANEGIFRSPIDARGAKVELLGDVNVTTGDGYQFLTPHIAINLADAIWHAKGGVRMKGQDSTLRATRLMADENKAIYRFQNIRMRLSPGQQEGR
ncbi:MAG TPA: hypothetical protein DCS39_06085 [Rhodobiaceae bacterium]|nr:hypothetical protein [Rhodobiaceae bacterium]|tara:strand:- start:376 stop:1011 length:636 start_codon:yes stop_codon:yes gene_type:complete